MLTGCASYGVDKNNISLPKVPSELSSCFGDGVPAPKPGTLSRQEAYNLIAALKKSETKKNQCGKKFEVWYETLSRELQKKE